MVERGLNDYALAGLVLDSARLRAATGWAPQVTLEEGIQRMWVWLKGSECPE